MLHDDSRNILSNEIKIFITQFCHNSIKQKIYNLFKGINELLGIKSLVYFFF